MENKMISEIYVLDGDSAEIVPAAMDADMRSGKTRYMIGETGCVIGFQNDADMVLFKLALPDGWTNVSVFDLAVAMPAEPSVIREIIAPVLEQCDLTNRVTIADFTEIFLPTVDDHRRMLQRIIALGCDAICA